MCMVERSRLELPTANAGGTVAVPMPMVNRGGGGGCGGGGGRGDPPNILGVVLNRDGK